MGASAPFHLVPGLIPSPVKRPLLSQKLPLFSWLPLTGWISRDVHVENMNLNLVLLGR